MAVRPRARLTPPAPRPRRWGKNHRLQLGDGSADAFKNTPVSVPGVSGASQVAVGRSHSCARTSSGGSCWGNNTGGALGDGMIGSGATPVQVSF